MKKIASFLFYCAAAFAVDITPYEYNIEPEEYFELTAFVAFRDEAEWLKEWIEYHRLLGVEHFYLYNNNSQDHYLDVVSPYVEEGLVELFDYPKDNFINEDHWRLMNHAIKHGKGKTKWLAIIDSDEFILPMKQDDIKEVLREYEEYSGVRLSWRVFGTSNVERLAPGELLIEKLTFRAGDGAAVNRLHKSIVQPDLSIRMCTCHDCCYLPNHKKSIKLPAVEMRINHYIGRTEEFLHTVKVPRVAHWKGRNFFGANSLLKFMEQANAIYDDAMLRFVPQLKETLSDF